MGAALVCPPSKHLRSDFWDLAQMYFAFSFSVRVSIALVKVATVSQSAEVAVAKLAMAVTNHLSSGIDLWT
jgi:hypothetical protein